MLRTLSLCLVLGLDIGSSAQSWCPPGATWTYDPDGFVFLQQGFTVRTYTNDTLLGGISGQVIRSYTVGIADQQVDTMTWPWPVITRSTGDLVSLWSHEFQSWDTLYDFSAVPGEGWGPPHSTITCGGATYGDLVQVIDTGTVLIDDMALHYLDIHVGMYNGRITQRTGWTQAMVIQEGCLADECACDLRCYRDNEIAYVAPQHTDACDAITGIEEHGARHHRPFPNPGTDHFTLALPPGKQTITLFDATGRVTLQQRTIGGLSTVSTALLPTGVYAVLVDDGSAPIRWVKY